jgi:lipid-binding SYLF domain-containing protein
MRFSKSTLVAVLAMAVFAWGQQNSGKSNTAEARLQDATEILQSMTGPQSSAGIPDAVLKDAKCIAIVPGLVKGAFIIGGEHGKGVATCRTQNGWSAPAFFEVSGGSFGAQIGGEKTDLVMMMMNDQGMQQLLSGKFKVGANASAAAGPVGRQAAAEGGWKAAILTYSRSKGAFAGVSLSGAEIQQDNSAMRKLYGKPVTFRQALAGKVPPPPQAQAFLHEVEHAETVASNQ